MLYKINNIAHHYYVYKITLAISYSNVRTTYYLCLFDAPWNILFNWKIKTRDVKLIKTDHVRDRSENTGLYKRCRRKWASTSQRTSNRISYVVNIYLIGSWKIKNRNLREKWIRKFQKSSIGAFVLRSTKSILIISL